MCCTFGFEHPWAYSQGYVALTRTNESETVVILTMVLRLQLSATLLCGFTIFIDIHSWPVRFAVV